MTSDRSNRGPLPVGQVLGKNSVLSALKARTHLHQKLLQQIQAGLPEGLAGHCLACVLRVDGLLVIYTDSPAWGCQLRFYQNAILSQVATVGAVRQIKIRILNFSPSAKAANEVSDSIKVPAEAVLSQLLWEAENSYDEALRQALVALVEAMRHRLAVNKLGVTSPRQGD